MQERHNLQGVASVLASAMDGQNKCEGSNHLTLVQMQSEASHQESFLMTSSSRSIFSEM
jgi:hypothetical protein